MYIQLPDYDDFQGYDLGMGWILSHIAHEIYANFHKPSWETLEHHLFMAETPKKLPKQPDSVARNDKRKIPKQEMMFDGVAIPIANTFGELVEMDFADYGDFATFVHIRDAFHVSRQLF